MGLVYNFPSTLGKEHKCNACIHIGIIKNHQLISKLYYYVDIIMMMLFINVG